MYVFRQALSMWGKKIDSITLFIKPNAIYLITRGVQVLKFQVTFFFTQTWQVLKKLKPESLVFLRQKSNKAID